MRRETESSMVDRDDEGWAYGMANGQIPEFDLTALLAQCSAGDRQAFGEVFTHLYRDIHAIAVRELRGERHQTIRPTALVNEAFLRMQGLREIRWQDRAHVLAMASRMTRQALVDAARRRRAEKRDGGDAVTLSDEQIERVRQHFSAGCHSQDRVNVGEVIVQVRGMYADEISQGRLHRFNSSMRNAKCQAEIAEIVIVTQRSDRIEQRANRVGIVFVDVRIRPDHGGGCVRF